jgi:ABC-2 type transport system permease protein
MFNAKPLDQPNKKPELIDVMGGFMLRIGSILELMIILTLWLLVFTQVKSVAGLSWQEVVTYLLIGNIIGFAASFMWSRVIGRDLNTQATHLLEKEPRKYFLSILPQAFLKFFPAFIVVVIINWLLLRIFIGSFPVNSNPSTLIIILIMVIFAFISELLLAYLIRLNIFWTIESVSLYRVLLRTKKILAGAYFPLTLLPAAFLSVSLFLPFAYSFFVPTQLYLGNLDISVGYSGLAIQSIWIIILFMLIRLSWNSKLNKQKQ